MTDALQVLEQIAGLVKDCTRCELQYGRRLAVPGEGPADARILLIGEGPGFHENVQGRPFVGQAGKLLDELLASVHLNREQVFITNVVKCRPPGNRDPLPAEVSACSDYLDHQIEVINPQVIITLGRYSMGKYLPNAKISAVHGQALWVRGRLIVPMYHPAAALHMPSLRPELERDFARLPEYLAQAASGAHIAPAVEAASPAAPAPRAAQPDMLSLFSQPRQEDEPESHEVRESGQNEPDEPPSPTQLSLF
jgi:uracil-DNA glycosylase